MCAFRGRENYMGLPGLHAAVRCAQGIMSSAAWRAVNGVEGVEGQSKRFPHTLRSSFAVDSAVLAEATTTEDLSV